MWKISSYFYTIKSLKPSQVYYRIRKKLGLECSLDCKVRELDENDLRPLSVIGELDYDPDFLERFDPDGLLKDRVSFLHVERKVDWNQKWEYEDQTPLWNFNLHYFEYLLPLINAYKTTGKTEYFDKTKQCILAWIKNNPVSKRGNGWSPYTVALRLMVWLDYYSDMQNEIKKDEGFCHSFMTSLYEQYVFLSGHLEKDLLANHYFEDLKTLVMCSIFFKDDQYLSCVLTEFKEQCKEQILNDGMHCERSPMYHKIILEDILRVAYELKMAGTPDREIEGYIQPMLDAAYSLEKGLERIPLFNDCGNNVSKSLNALVITAKKYFDISPEYKKCFPDSGYYIFEQADWKLIVFAGEPKPKYEPGHAHCDAMSFELFKNGVPQIVNCGTYAYQCKERDFFRGTSAHNTVMADSTEQFEYWASFRVAKRSSVTVLQHSPSSITMKLVDQKRHEIVREILLKDGYLEIKDRCEGRHLSAFYHLTSKNSIASIEAKGKNPMDHDIKCKTYSDNYAYDFGIKESVQTLKFDAESNIEIYITFDRRQPPMKQNKS